MITQNNRIGTARLIGLMTQTGTNVPIITPVINTVGEYSILRLAAGQYIISLPITPTSSKATTRANGRVDGAVPMLLSIAALNDNYIQFNINEEQIQVDVKNAAGTRVDLSTLGGGLIEIPITIEVYQNIQTL